MLGLMELMAAQDASVDEMPEAAKMVNRFWFPEQTSHLALYYQAQGAESFNAIPAREAVSLDRFSADGYATVHNWLVANGEIDAPGQGGNSCGIWGGCWREQSTTQRRGDQTSHSPFVVQSGASDRRR